jgi:hypothetical protein
MSIAIASHVRLNVSEQEMQPDIGHTIGKVHDLANYNGVEVALVCWPQKPFWHKVADLELAE